MLDATRNPTAARVPDDEPRRWWLGSRLRRGVSLVSLGLLLVVLAQWARSLYHDAHTTAGRYDFSTYYAAAYALRHNLHADIYSQAVLLQSGAAAHVTTQPLLAYTYPPLFALLLSPFTLLSFRVLSRLWLLGNAVLWLGTTALLAREITTLLRPVLSAYGNSTSGREEAAEAPALTGLPLPNRPALAGIRSWLLGAAEDPALVRAHGPLDDPLPLAALALAAWLSLTFVPAVQTLITGQINFFVLVALALVPLLLHRGHDRWAGAAVAVAAILKFTPALLIVYLLLRRRWQAAASALVVLAGLLVVSLLLVGPAVTAASISQALNVGMGDAGLGHNQALFAPLLLDVSLHAPAQLGTVTLFARVGVVLLALALGYVIWRLPAEEVHQTPLGSGRRATSRPFRTGDAAAYGMVLCGLLLLSPTAWVHHYVWVLPAAAIALGLTGSAVVSAIGARDVRGVAVAVVTFAAVALACAALGVSLPYDWDTNPQPAITHAGLLVWPLALLLRPVATLVLAGLLAFLGSSSRAHARPMDANAAPMDPFALASNSTRAGG